MTRKPRAGEFGARAMSGVPHLHGFSGEPRQPGISGEEDRNRRREHRFERARAVIDRVKVESDATIRHLSRAIERAARSQRTRGPAATQGTSGSP